MDLWHVAEARGNQKFGLGRRPVEQRRRTEFGGTVDGIEYVLTNGRKALGLQIGWRRQACAGRKHQAGTEIR
jgi:hypothetical protein